MFSLIVTGTPSSADRGCLDRQRASEALAAAIAPSRSTRYMAFSFGSQAATRSSAARAASMGDRPPEAYCAATCNASSSCIAAMDRIIQSASYATPTGFDGSLGCRRRSCNDGTRGSELEALVQRYNSSQTQVRVTAVYKGSYDKTMNEALAAQRTGQGPT